MGKVITFVFGLVLLAGCAAGVKAPAVEHLPSIGVRVGTCPDGSPIQMEIKDADPSNPEAVVVIWSRPADRQKSLPDRVVAILMKPSNRIWIAKERKEYSLEEARAKWDNPCSLPDPGIQV